MNDILDFLKTHEGKWLVGIAGGILTALISKLTIRYFKDLKMDQKIFQADIKGSLNSQNSEFKSEFKIIQYDISDIKKNQDEMSKNFDEQKKDIKSIQIHVRSMEILRKTTERRKEQLKSSLEHWATMNIDACLKEIMMIYGEKFIEFVMDSHERIATCNFDEITTKGKVLVNSLRPHFKRIVKEYFFKKLCKELNEKESNKIAEKISEEFTESFFLTNHNEATAYLSICRDIVYTSEENNKNPGYEIFTASQHFFQKILLNMHMIYLEVSANGRINN